MQVMMSDRILRKVKRVMAFLRQWHVCSWGAWDCMENLHGWGNKIQSGKWNVHWYDVALLKRKERELEALRRRTRLQPKDLHELSYALEGYGGDFKLSPNFLPELCWKVIDGDKDVKKLGADLHELVSLSFFLAYWVKTPQYEVGALRQVVTYERDLLIQRQQA